MKKVLMKFPSQWGYFSMSLCFNLIRQLQLKNELTVVNQVYLGYTQISWSFRISYPDKQIWTTLIFSIHFTQNGDGTYQKKLLEYRHKTQIHLLNRHTPSKCWWWKERISKINFRRVLFFQHKCSIKANSYLYFDFGKIPRSQLRRNSHQCFSAKQVNWRSEQCQGKSNWSCKRRASTSLEKCGTLVGAK